MTRPVYPAQPKFVDCLDHGPGSELLLVEGDSALSSVVAVRQPQHQAVLALQGKPLNAWTATPARVNRHAQYQALAAALGLLSATAGGEKSGVEMSRFGKLVLLFDPDADGIHIGALLVLYVQRWLPQLIKQQGLWQVRAPMFELVCSASGQVLQAQNPAQRQQLSAHLSDAAGGQAPRVQVYRGLGSIAPAVLRRDCVDPATRQAQAISSADVQVVIELFGGGVLR